MNNTSSIWIKLNLRPDASSKRKKNMEQRQHWGMLSWREGVKWGRGVQKGLFLFWCTGRESVTNIFEVLVWHSYFSGHGLEGNLGKWWLRMKRLSAVTLLLAQRKLLALESTPFPICFSGSGNSQQLETWAPYGQNPCSASWELCVLELSSLINLSLSFFICKIKIIRTLAFLSCQEDPMNTPRSNS